MHYIAGLQKQMKISGDECHFGYFDMDMLERAYVIFDDVKDKEMSLNSRGDVRFSCGKIHNSHQQSLPRIE